MDKKKVMRGQTNDDLKGFEEFLDHIDTDNSVDKVSKNIGGEKLTFLYHDNTRLKNSKQVNPTIHMAYLWPIKCCKSLRW